MSNPTISREMLEIQRKTNDVLRLHGGRCADPEPNESLESFRQSCLAAIMPHCSPGGRFRNWAGVSDEDALNMSRADAIAWQRRPEGTLRPSVETNAVGINVTRWDGDPLEAWAPFSMPPRYAKINDHLAKGAYAGGRGLVHHE